MLSLVKQILIKAGIYKPPLALESALQRCASRNPNINTVIDVGASNGCWSSVASKYFPSAFYYLIEANPFHEKSLEQYKATTVNTNYILAAAGDSTGEIYFDSCDPFGGLASHQRLGENDIKVPVITIDDVVKDNKLSPPYLIKLDTHGFEIPIFEGAAKTLTETELIIVETYNFDIAPNSLRFYQICQYLETKGFRCVDMCDPLFRAKDKAFWQIDLFFIPATNPIFQNNQWG